MKVTLTKKQLAEVVNESAGTQVDETWIGRQIKKLFGGGNQQNAQQAPSAANTRDDAGAAAAAYAANARGQQAGNNAVKNAPGDAAAAGAAYGANAAQNAPNDAAAAGAAAAASYSANDAAGDAAGIAAGIKISELLNPTDVAGAITAGIVAYVRNNASADDKQQPEAPEAEVTPTEPTQAELNGLSPAPDDAPTVPEFQPKVAPAPAPAPAVPAVPMARPEKVFTSAFDTGMYSPTNPPNLLDTTHQATRFWLEHPEIAKAHGLIVKNVVKSAQGISGFITRPNLAGVGMA